MAKKNNDSAQPARSQQRTERQWSRVEESQPDFIEDSQQSQELGGTTRLSREHESRSHQSAASRPPPGKMRAAEPTEESQYPDYGSSDDDDGSNFSPTPPPPSRIPNSQPPLRNPQPHAKPPHRATKPTEQAANPAQKNASERKNTAKGKQRENNERSDEDNEGVKRPRRAARSVVHDSQTSVAGYKDRRELARRMRLEPTDGQGVRERREYVRMQCLRRDINLNKRLSEYDEKKVYRVVKSVTVDMRAQYGDWWPSELTRDMMHAICLDRVRNTRARDRAAKVARKKSGVPVSDSEPEMPRRLSSPKKARQPPQKAASQPQQQRRRDVESDSDESGTPVPRKTLPPPLAPVDATPIARVPSSALTPMSSLTGPSSRLTIQDEEDDLRESSSPLYVRSSFPEAPSSRLESSPSETRVNKKTSIPLPTEDDQSDMFPVYISGQRPIYVSPDAGCKGFLLEMEKVLTWPDNRFLQYRPSGSRGTWLPISVNSEFVKMVSSCREVGARVRVVPESWFASDDEGNSEPEESQPHRESQAMTQVARTKKAKPIPDVMEAKGKKAAPRARKANTQVTTPKLIDEPEGHATQPLPGYAADKRVQKRKANTTDTVPTAGNSTEPSPETGIIKRKPGRPRKKPAGLETLTPQPPVETRSGRVVKPTEKVADVASLQAEKQEADQMLIARRELKIARNEFNIAHE